MFLAVDIGNSNIVLGVKCKDEWTQIWRAQTVADKTADEYALIIRGLMYAANLCVDSFNRVVVSSVVPSLTETFIQVIKRIFSIEPLVVNADCYPRLPIKIVNIQEIGTDLVANALAASELCVGNCMVIDFGTALTFTTVNRENEIAGVAIAPGIKTAMKALVGNTAQLHAVPLVNPQSVLGRDTKGALQAGVITGYLGLIKSIIDKTRAELGGELVVMATGGLSKSIAAELSVIEVTDPILTLKGLWLIGHYNLD